MTNALMTHYPSLLLTEQVSFVTPASHLAILNPATLLPNMDDFQPVYRSVDILAEETGT